MAPRTKVAVLGGGVGAMVAAFELTATPELRDRFEVTVHQLGWRIGGKGASGREMDKGARILEHGLHVWFGFYDTAWHVMRECYEELNRDPSMPLHSLESAFTPCDEIVLYDRGPQLGGPNWAKYPFTIPPNDLKPGESSPHPSLYEMVNDFLTWWLSHWDGVATAHPALRQTAPAAPASLPKHLEGILHKVTGDAAGLAVGAAEKHLDAAVKLIQKRIAGDIGGPLSEELLVWLLNGVRDLIWAVGHDVIKDHSEPRFYFSFIDVAISTVAGIVEDGLLEKGFQAVDDEEWCAWLTRHGAKPTTIGTTPEDRAPILRAVYDVAFGYVDGDINKANVAAGTATNDLLRLMFTYRGAVFQKMNAGMGDTVFGPFYEVLKKRGVKFEFFSAVENITLSPDQALVQSIDVVEQVDLTVPEYSPTKSVNNLDCWPSEPLWDQLQDGAKLKANGVNFEYDFNPLGKQATTLQLGVDFDVAVLGISVASLKQGAVPDLAAQLRASNARFATAVETAVTVRTQAFQIWATEPTDELEGATKYNPWSVTGAYVEPLDTYCDMSHLIGREDWGPTDVKSIAYFCGVLGENEGNDQASATAAAKANALKFLNGDIGTLWPRAVDGDVHSALKWDLLYDPSNATGPARFDAQYWRANIAGSERYVLTPAGTVKDRLPSGGWGVQNLVCAGDWTDNGINGGCVEAAAISGMRAAHFLIGDDYTNSSEDVGWLGTDRARLNLPDYVEYGGRATAPGPFNSTGGQFKGMLVHGDAAKIASFVERVYSAPSDNIDFRPVLPEHMVLMYGQFASVKSMTPPFDTWGSVCEVQVGWFLPMFGGSQQPGGWTADRFVIAIPYILVDNPMSYAGGREDFGYPKSLGIFDPPAAVADSLKVKAYGGNFSPTHLAAWCPFLDIEPLLGGNVPVKPTPSTDPAKTHFGNWITEIASVVGGGNLVPGLECHWEGMRIPGSVIDQMLGGTANQLFLKQFRDAGNWRGACFQQVIEVPLTITFRQASDYLDDPRSITIQPLDSHPIGLELGVASQDALLTWDLAMDFIVDPGFKAPPPP